MKLIAESQPAKSIPFNHLGYLSANTVARTRDAMSLTAGLILVAVGFVMALKLVPGRTDDGQRAIHLMFRKAIPRIVGLVLLIFGLAFIFFGIGTTEEQVKHPALELLGEEAAGQDSSQDAGADEQVFGEIDPVPGSETELDSMHYAGAEEEPAVDDNSGISPEH